MRRAVTAGCDGRNRGPAARMLGWVRGEAASPVSCSSLRGSSWTYAGGGKGGQNELSPAALKKGKTVDGGGDAY
jgi:hypothetical protein